METPEQGRPALKRSPYQERFLTIVVMGGLGRVRSFRVSRRILAWSSLFLAAFIIVSVVIINRYLDLRERNNILLDRLSFLEEDLNRNKKALERSRQMAAFLEEYILYTDERPDAPTHSGKEAAAHAKRGEASKAASSKEAAEGGKAKLSADALQMKDILIEKEGAKLSVSLKLVVSQPGGTPAEGYLHIIAEDGKSNPRQWWAYPQQRVTNGLPDNYRNGHNFSIYRYKPIHGRIYLGSRALSPSAIKLLIYDQAGNLVTEKILEVTHES
jgi:hypothetical protein